MIDAPGALTAGVGLLPPPYGGACLEQLLPALEQVLEGDEPRPWLPPELGGARSIVLLVLDGFGATQLERFADWAPTLAGAPRTTISTVAPTTTVAALTSLSTAVPPAAHGLVGYRIAVEGSVLNVLRWTTAEGDARRRFDPASLQALEPLAAGSIPVVTRAEFAGSGFTLAHLRGAPLVGWREPAAIAPLAASALGSGARLVYAYYDAIDHAAHEVGLSEAYEQAVRSADVVVGELRRALPADAVLVVTADHGHLLRPCRAIELDPGVARAVAFCSGEGRFRWLHAVPGASEDLLGACRSAYSEAARVLGRGECLALGLLGAPGEDRFAERLGDVLLVPGGDTWFVDPADSGEGRQVSRHGGMHDDESLVPVAALVR